jgi:hypothetical protein
MPEHPSPRRPVFKISLSERPGRHILERHPRYAVLVNGEERGELYYNMRGYQGYLPTVQGSKMDIGERGISAFRKEIRILNREAADAIERGAADPRRVVLTRPTEDRRILFALSREAATGAEAMHLISRSELLQAERLFGGPEIGVGFFSEHGVDPDSAPGVLLHEDDEELVGKMGRLPARMMTLSEAETYEREIERVIPTCDPDTLIVISRRTRDGAEPEPAFVSKWGYDIAAARYGDGMRLSDLELVDTRPAVPDPQDRAYLRANFTWLDVAEPDPADPDPQAGPA